MIWKPFARLLQEASSVELRTFFWLKRLRPDRLDPGTLWFALEGRASPSGGRRADGRFGNSRSHQVDVLTTRVKVEPVIPHATMGGSTGMRDPGEGRRCPACGEPVRINPHKPYKTTNMLRDHD